MKTKKVPEQYTDRKLSARYPTDLGSWQALKKHYRESMQRKTLRELFARDKQRPQHFSMQAGDLLLDYSKTHVNKTTLKLLTRLAREASVPQAIDAMFAGDAINATEGRSVLHVALRSKISDTVALETEGVRDVWKVLTDIENFVDAVHGNTIRGHTGKKLTHIVNIGIGGSDLGPVMAAQALRPYWSAGMHFHSVSNIDGTQLTDLKAELDPASTLFVVCSKTFTTIETMTNANAARQWVAQVLGEGAVSSHFVAASTNHEAMDEFGIAPNKRFGFWDWVGGRYSLWSAVGLSLALVIGMQNFRRLLAGGRMLDQHFRLAPMGENLPVQLALLGVWYNNFFGAATQAILPYDNRLARFPAYLQQLQMESSGKSVRMDGKPVRCDTGMVIWGESGNNAQHSFYQLLHQGTRLIPADFLLSAKTSGGTQVQHKLAIDNGLAQAEALMDGFDEKGTSPYRVHKGNNPSNTILFEQLTPEVLGQLIALYEHKVFVEGVVWGINSFDQFGVELGKKLAGGINKSTNPSTRFLLDKVR